MFCYLFIPWKGLPPNIPCWDGPPVPPKRLVTGGFVDDAKPKDGPFDCVRFEKREGCDGFEELVKRDGCPCPLNSPPCGLVLVNSPFWGWLLGSPFDASPGFGGWFEAISSNILN